MKVTVLVDNDSLVSTTKAEHGLSLFIEDEEVAILFDTGKTGLLLENALQLNINLNKIDYLVLSHGHYDHTGGLPSFIESCKKNHVVEFPRLICHPDALCRRGTYFNSSVCIKNLSSPLTSKEITDIFPATLSEKPLWLNDKFVFLGEIPRNISNDEDCFGEIYKNGLFCKDVILDDSSLVYNSSHGLIIFTGCAHSGICNTIEYAKQICKENRIVDVIGGFHLNGANVEKLHKVKIYLENNQPKNLHACHCTGKGRGFLPNQENIGVGKVLNY